MSGARSGTRLQRTDLVAFAAGVVFALGLGISGMTQPGKVLAFLDVAGAWDPSLALVMGGAIAVYFSFAQRIRRGAPPLLVGRYFLPDATAIDARLLTGAALFGLGWGIAGYCPGPAVVAVVTFAPGALAFVGAMIAGMALHAALFERAAVGGDKRAGGAVGEPTS